MAFSLTSSIFAQLALSLCLQKLTIVSTAFCRVGKVASAFVVKFEPVAAVQTVGVVLIGKN